MKTVVNQPEQHYPNRLTYNEIKNKPGLYRAYYSNGVESEFVLFIGSTVRFYVCTNNNGGSEPSCFSDESFAGYTFLALPKDSNITITQ